MSEIVLNEISVAMIKKAMAEGKKSVIMYDLLINIYGDKIKVTNAHTGDEMKVLNWD